MVKPGLPRIPGSPQNVFVSSRISQTSEVLQNLIKSLGLPQDRLSATLISFIRYFSLPQEPELLMRLRREVLSTAAHQGAENREALALGAAAAAAKGLILGGEALEEYGRTIDTEKRQDRQSDSENREGDKSGSGSGGSARGEGGSGGQTSGERSSSGRQEKDPSGFLEPGEIREAAEKAEEQSPLTLLLNRLPGKDGHRWVVLPLDLDVGGLAIRLSLRILLTGDRPPFQAERLAADLDVQKPTGKKHRWLFTLDRTGEQGFRTEVRVDPPFPQTAMGALQKQIREALGPFGEQVHIRDPMVFAADSRNEALFSVDQTV